MTSFNINKATHKDAQKQEKIRSMTKSPNENEAKVAAKKLRPSAAVSLPLKNEYQPSLAELVLGEEMCGKGHYWCNTDKQCKKIPSGFKIDGQPTGTKRTEVGIGKPVAEEKECNHSKKGKNCPIHGNDDCTVKEERDPKGPVKKYKSPKEIAAKHNVSVEEIKKQLEMGIKVEGEHTSNKTAARITALQHLDEVPDYYTKLKKVESKSTTSESVTIEDMFGNKFVEFIDLITPQDVIDEKKGLWDNIHDRREKGLPRKKPGQKGYPKTLNVENHVDIAMGKELDDEGSMILNQLEQIEMHCKRLREEIKNPKMQVPAWVQSKITLATDYMDSAANYMAGKNEEYEIDEAKIPVTRQAGEFRYSGKTGEEKAERRAKVLSNSPDPKKRRQANTIRSKIKTVADRDTARASSDARQKLYRGQQRRANDLARQLMNKEEHEIGEAVRLPAEFGNLIAAIVMWRGRTQQLTMFFPQAKMPSKKDVQREVEKIYPGGKVITFGITDIASNYSAIDAPIVRVGYHGGNLGKPGPNKNYVKPMGEEFEVDEDWQKVNRQDKTDGLSKKAVNAYRRENPGSKLQTAVTEKNPEGKRAKRRSNFCSRMKGMKSKLTSAETSRDPDSRINKALRRWNCN
jgi:hypothetical protein